MNGREIREILMQPAVSRAMMLGTENPALTKLVKARKIRRGILRAKRNLQQDVARHYSPRMDAGEWYDAGLSLGPHPAQELAMQRLIREAFEDPTLPPELRKNAAQ